MCDAGPEVLMLVRIVLFTFFVTPVWATYDPVTFVASGGSANSNFDQTSTSYMSITGNIVDSIVETSLLVLAPSLRPARFACQISGAPGAGNTYAFTVRNGASSTDWSCTVSEPNTTCEDLSGSVINESTRSVEIVPASTPTARAGICVLEGRF